MSYSKQSSTGAADIYSPQSTLISGGSTMNAHQTPSTENSFGPQHANAVVSVHRGSGYGTDDCIKDIRQICKDSQGRVQALGQAIGRQPGMPSSLSDLLNNDLRVIAQQFATITYYCHMLEKRVDERGQPNFFERELNSCRQQVQDGRVRIAKLEQDLRDMDHAHSVTDKRRRVELEKKKDKIDNQKRRIKEQQDQIDTLKKKNTSDGGNSKSVKATKSKKDVDSSPEPAFPHSATSELATDPTTPTFPEPKYSSTLDGADEQFLLSNLKKLNADLGSDGLSYPLPPTGASRMERGNPMHHGAMPPFPAYGTYGPGMPSMGPMGPMNGAMAPYGGFHPMAPYGPPMPSFGRGTMPTNGHAPPYHGYASPGYRGPGKFGQPRSASHSARGSESHQSNALVLRRNDDSEFDPETKVWKDMFFRLFAGVNGWTHTYGSQIVPGAVEEATKSNPKLWQYILKVAACYKDPNAAPKHALFMLNSPEHRCHFISRLILQYVEQEMLHPKFWFGWDEETDAELTKIGPVLDFIGYPLDQRRAARQQLRTVVEGIVKDEEYSRFRAFKTSEHSKRLKDIVGPFLAGSSAVHGTDASVGLLSIANTAMEISHKIMASRLSFMFTWNECAVKFSHDSHIALNSDLQGLALQHKHTRICLVVTPSISYRDDNGVSIVPRGVTKAQVLVMN